MKIAVFVKLVPDSAATFTVDNGQPNWGDAPLVINPWDEYAVEAALALNEEHGGDVVAVSLGGENAKEALKHALAMGSSEAILVSDEALASLDAAATARVMAAVVQKIGDVDLAVFGKSSIDNDSGMSSAMTGRVLGWPSLSLVSAVQSVGDTITVERSMEEGRQVVESPLPATMSVVKDFGEPRYPSFMGIRKASKAEIPTWSLADLDVEAPSAAVTRIEIMAPPKREVTSEIIEGSSPAEIAAKLADKIIAEGVL